MQRNTAATAVRSAYAALQAGRFAEARDLAAPYPADAGAALLHALGRAGAGDVAGGAAAIAAIARRHPGARHPVLDLVELLARLDRRGEALAHLRAAVQVGTDDAAVHAALGEALAGLGPMAEAVTAFRQATALLPADAAHWSNLGKALAASGAFEEAETAFGRATVLAPGHVQVTLNHALSRLKSGRWAEGWELFRARHRLPGHPPPLPGPELRSLEGIAGRRVLLAHGEGYGDTLQFIRYAPLLTALGARVQVLVPPALRRLMIDSGLDVVDDAAGYDAWVHIPDLPAVFGTTPATVPPPLRLVARPAPHPDSPPAPGRRVGLVWAGAARIHDPAAAATDRIRSLDPALLAPLLATADVTWVSLQKGHTPPPGVFDPMPGVTDFADTAALISGLEMVVSVDTAVAHLAASLGTPVLLLDRFDNCWRWLSGRTDSPWYPGMVRIVRQASPGDWDGVIQAAGRLIA